MNNVLCRKTFSCRKISHRFLTDYCTKVFVPDRTRLLCISITKNQIPIHQQQPGIKCSRYSNYWFLNLPGILSRPFAENCIFCALFITFVYDAHDSEGLPCWPQFFRKMLFYLQNIFEIFYLRKYLALSNDTDE